MSAGDLGGPRFAAVAAAARSCQTRQPRLSATRVWTRGPPCDARRARPPRAVPSSAATRAVRDSRGSRDVLSNLERSVFGQRKTRRTTYGDLVRKVPRNGPRPRRRRNSAPTTRSMLGVGEKAPAVASAPWRSLGACDARGTPGRRSGRRGKPHGKTTTTTRPPRAATGAPLSARDAPRPRRPRLVSARSWHS